MKHLSRDFLAPSEDLLELIGKLQLAVAASRMGVWEFDEANGKLHWDDRMLEIYGITDGENDRPFGTWEAHLHPEDYDQMIAYAETCRLNNTDFQHDYRIVRADGSVRHVRSLARRVSAPGDSGKFVGVNIDITDDYRRAEELKKAQAQLKHDARHDVLTGLGNRRALDEMTQSTFDLIGLTDQYALALVDLDHFKDVNDRLGHLAGDHVLKTVATLLCDAVTDALGDLGRVFRVGGDEFAIFFATAPDETELASLCDTLVTQIGMPIGFEGHDCNIGASIGYAFGTGQPTSPTQIFSDADTALYEVKRNGRGGHCAYSAELGRNPAKATNMRSDLRNALSDGAFICHYQPQFDATTLDVVGAEALVRWDCPQRGLLAPADFLPAAHELKMVNDIDAAVLLQVTRDQDQWHRDGIDYPVVAVNTSADRLKSSDFIDTLDKVLAPHHKVAVELLETAFLDEIDEATRANLNALRARGIRIDLDDFGSGHSSVTALQTVLPHQAKIDRSLVRPLKTNPRQIMTLQALCRIARLASARPVVEGLESGMMLAAIRSLDCEVLQGYALQRPIPAIDFAAFLRRASQAAE